MSERLAALVDTDRLWQSLMDMAELGALPNGGCCRTALSEVDKEGRDLFVRWCEEAGCEISVDRIGNIFARRPGRDNSLPAASTGSHLDTQPHGGKFDGVYGVLAGLEVVRALNVNGIGTRAPIDVVVWTNEEGARFSPPLAGSSVFVGKFEVETIHAASTWDDTTVLNDLKSIGYLGTEVPGERVLDCFVEAHIEQGPILEAAGRPIGVVEQIQGIRWFSVRVTGQDSHAGTTPMNLRRDALAGAAEMVTELRRFARNLDEQTRLTVGRFQVSPGSEATIPGQVDFSIDTRHPDPALLEHVDGEVKTIIGGIATEHRLEATIATTIDAPAVHFSGELVDIIRGSAVGLGYEYLDMLSGAGHDAMNLASVVPTAMIFVPCKDGISHNEAEYAKPEDLACGANTLLHTLVARAGRA